MCRSITKFETILNGYGPEIKVLSLRIQDGGDGQQSVVKAGIMPRNVLLRMFDRFQREFGILTLPSEPDPFRGLNPFES
jgi:hypothetical protein